MTKGAAPCIHTDRQTCMSQLTNFSHECNNLKKIVLEKEGRNQPIVSSALFELVYPCTIAHAHPESWDNLKEFMEEMNKFTASPTIWHLGDHHWSLHWHIRRQQLHRQWHFQALLPLWSLGRKEKVKPFQQVTQKTFIHCTCCKTYGERVKYISCSRESKFAGALHRAPHRGVYCLH